MTFARPSPDIQGKILILPIVSTANVAQLAADILIATFGLRRLAVLDPSYLVPVVGPSEYEADELATAIELYGADSVPFAVVQQRAPVLKAHKQEFVDALLAFVQETKPSALITLSGVDMSNRMDEQMMIPTYHIIPPGTSDMQSSPLRALTGLPIPPYASPVPQFLSTPGGIPDGAARAALSDPGASLSDPINSLSLSDPINSSSRTNDPTTTATALPFIPGGGLTRRLLGSLPPGWPVPTAALLHFVLEGDNRGDAQLLAAVVARVVGVDAGAKGWRQPPSWGMGLFGTPQDQTLYG
ncbi:PAC2 family-domain-containing protein [Schizophyllum fasciatum]